MKKNSVHIFAGKFSQTIMTVVKSQSFCGGQNGLTILAKIIFKSLENIFDHLVRPFWPIFFWESFDILWPQWSTVVGSFCNIMRIVVIEWYTKQLI